MHFGRPLAPFWLPFAPFWSLRLPLGTPFAPFYYFWTLRVRTFFKKHVFGQPLSQGTRRLPFAPCLRGDIVAFLSSLKGPERNLAAGNLDPLRARRRPGRVRIYRGSAFSTSPFSTSPFKQRNYFCFSSDRLYSILLICMSPRAQRQTFREWQFFDLFFGSIF